MPFVSKAGKSLSQRDQMAKIGKTSDFVSSHRYSADLESLLSGSEALLHQYQASSEPVNERWSVTLCQFSHQSSRFCLVSSNPDEEHCGELMPQISAHKYDRAYYGSTPSQDSLSLRSRFSTPLSRAQSPESDEPCVERCTLPLLLLPSLHRALPHARQSLPVAACLSDPRQPAQLQHGLQALLLRHPRHLPPRRRQARRRPLRPRRPAEPFSLRRRARRASFFACRHARPRGTALRGVGRIAGIAGSAARHVAEARFERINRGESVQSRGIESVRGARRAALLRFPQYRRVQASRGDVSVSARVFGPHRSGGRSNSQRKGVFSAGLRCRCR